jgi:predicted nucleic acid-binding protein
MVSYIVDASIIIQRLIRQPFTPNVQALFSSLTPADRLIAPEFCLIECTNVIWKQARFFGMTHPQAEQLVKDLRFLPLKRAPVKKLLDDALRIGLKHQLAVYDSVYIVLAQQVGFPLITVDQQQEQAALAEGVSIKAVTDFEP